MCNFSPEGSRMVLTVKIGKTCLKFLIWGQAFPPIYFFGTLGHFWEFSTICDNPKIFSSFKSKIRDHTHQKKSGPRLWLTGWQFSPFHFLTSSRLGPRLALRRLPQHSLVIWVDPFFPILWSGLFFFAFFCCCYFRDFCFWILNLWFGYQNQQSRCRSKDEWMLIAVKLKTLWK